MASGTPRRSRGRCDGRRGGVLRDRGQRDGPRLLTQSQDEEPEEPDTDERTTGPGFAAPVSWASRGGTARAAGQDGFQPQRPPRHVELADEFVAALGREPEPVSARGQPLSLSRPVSGSVRPTARRRGIPARREGPR